MYTFFVVHTEAGQSHDQSINQLFVCVCVRVFMSKWSLVHFYACKAKCINFVGCYLTTKVFFIGKLIFLAIRGVWVIISALGKTASEMIHKYDSRIELEDSISLQRPVA